MVELLWLIPIKLLEVELNDFSHEWVSILYVMLEEQTHLYSLNLEDDKW